jgi:ComF family protein
VCGIPTVSPLTTLCASCIKEAPPFSKALYFGLYEGALRESIHLYKFGGVRRLSRPLSLLLQSLPIPRVDAIIPVPLHENSLRRREFNQTARIACRLSRDQGIPLRLRTLDKVRETLPQTEVSGKERLSNVKNAFSVRGDLEGLRLLLLDDVITTGATVRTCAEALIGAGAKDIVVLALARSVPKYLT